MHHFHIHSIVENLSTQSYFMLEAWEMQSLVEKPQLYTMESEAQIWGGVLAGLGSVAVGNHITVPSCKAESKQCLKNPFHLKVTPVV